jgi:hypothetical protein
MHQKSCRQVYNLVVISAMSFLVLCWWENGASAEYQENARILLANPSFSSL